MSKFQTYLERAQKINEEEKGKELAKHKKNVPVYAGGLVGLLGLSDEMIKQARKEASSLMQDPNRGHMMTELIMIAQNMTEGQYLSKSEAKKLLEKWKKHDKDIERPEIYEKYMDFLTTGNLNLG